MIFWFTIYSKGFCEFRAWGERRTWNAAQTVTQAHYRPGAVNQQHCPLQNKKKKLIQTASGHCKQYCWSILIEADDTKNMLREVYCDLHFTIISFTPTL